MYKARARFHAGHARIETGAMAVGGGMRDGPGFYGAIHGPATAQLQRDTQSTPE